jgi:pyruvate/2-oxoglutarate dehydrogenase complex dihydrolipoamide dehydrogenase (E3) component
MHLACHEHPRSSCKRDFFEVLPASVSSKSLRSATLTNEMKKAERLDFKSIKVNVEFDSVMQSVMADVDFHSPLGGSTDLSVQIKESVVKITSPTTEEANDQSFSNSSIIIGTGARPLMPQIPGIEQAELLTSDNSWSLREQLKRLQLFSGGQKGCGLTQSFQALGGVVTHEVMIEGLLLQEYLESNVKVMANMRKDGLDMRLSYKNLRIEVVGGRRKLVCLNPVDVGGMRFDFDWVRLSSSRMVNAQNYGEEKSQLAVSLDNGVEVGEYLATWFTNSSAVVGVSDTYHHSNISWYSMVNGLFGTLKRFKAGYRVLLWATYLPRGRPRWSQRSGRQGEKLSLDLGC